MLPLQIQPESHIPLYVQLRDQLRALVHSGELRAGRPHSGEPGIGCATWRAPDYRGERLRGAGIGRIDSGARGARDIYLRDTQAGGKLPRCRGRMGMAAGACDGKSLFADERGEEV